MLIDDIIQMDDSFEELSLIGERCTQFIEEARGHPLLKNLPTDYGDFHKVKVRKRRKRKEDTEEFAQTFNEAFEDEQKGLRERAVFANGQESFEPADNGDLEPFYIFPLDGFQFMFSGEVENSSYDYKAVFDAIFEEFGTDKGNEVVTDLLKFSYKSDDLHEGIEQGSEIILYNLPAFYAIRMRTVENYDKLMSSILRTQMSTQTT